MRVLLACAAFPPFGKGGGPATSALIARALVEAGHEVEVVTATDAPFADEVRDGYRVRSLGSPNLYADWWRPHPAWQRAGWHLLENGNPRAYVRMAAAIRRFRPDLLATASIENVNVAAWLAAHRAGVPVLHFPHSYFLLCWRGSMFRGGARCKGRCASCRVASVGKERLAARVGFVAGESRFIVDEHRRHGVFRDAVRFTIPTPADAVAPAPRAAPVGAGERVTIAALGNISPEKDLATLARAARRLAARHGDMVRFLVAGTGDPALVRELEAIFPAGQTRFLGWTDPEQVYAEADVVVVPSRWNEPYGRVSVEPLSRGIPVIVADSGGLPENVAAGESGHIFPAGDDGALAALLDRLVDDRGELARLSAGARAHSARFGYAPFVAALDRAVRVAGGRVGELAA